MVAIETEICSTPTKKGPNATGLSLLDEGSPVPVAAMDEDSLAAKDEDSDAYDSDSGSDAAGDDGTVVNDVIGLAKRWKMDLEKDNEKLKCLRFRNSKWLSVLCMIDPVVIETGESSG